MRQAFLCVGSPEEVIALLPQEEQEIGADVDHRFFDRLGIEEARVFRQHVTLTPFTRTYRTFVLAFSEATGEAQNALLKTLEEPAETAQIYIVVPREDVLIATVRSRLVPLWVPEKSGDIGSEASAFVSASIAERLARIAEKTKEKDHMWIMELLRGLELFAEKNKHTTMLREIVFVRNYIGAPGASKKMLLEHLALAF